MWRATSFYIVLYCIGRRRVKVRRLSQQYKEGDAIIALSLRNSDQPFLHKGLKLDYFRFQRKSKSYVHYFRQLNSYYSIDD